MPIQDEIERRRNSKEFQEKVERLYRAEMHPSTAHDPNSFVGFLLSPGIFEELEADGQFDDVYDAIEARELCKEFPQRHRSRIITAKEAIIPKDVGKCYYCEW